MSTTSNHPPFILVLYYSRHGSVLNLARAIAAGIESKGLEAKLRTVPSISAASHPTEIDYPEVTLDELVNCSGLALGSPCRFGTMAAPLKAFWEQTSTEWLAGKLIDKPACVFTSSSSMHGGNEATLLNMALPLIHHGMLLLGVPYSEPELHNTESGGTPYGASHVSGLGSSPTLTSSEKHVAKTLGQRLATVAAKIQ
jgi:NAD(P)H dehydrogenase (quinone)